MIYSGLTESQLSGMGTALTQGGTGLLHIAIQIMPYAIAFTIILLIFTLIQNWSRLKNKWNEYRYEKYMSSYKMYYKNTGGSREDWRKWKRLPKNNY